MSSDMRAKMDRSKLIDVINEWFTAPSKPRTYVLADRILALFAAQGWRNVSDPPDSDRWVLMMFPPPLNHSPTIGRYSPQAKEWHHGGAWSTDLVTHWHELPTPPSHAPPATAKLPIPHCGYGPDEFPAPPVPGNSPEIPNSSPAPPVPGESDRFHIQEQLSVRANDGVPPNGNDGTLTFEMKTHAGEVKMSMEPHAARLFVVGILRAIDKVENKARSQGECRMCGFHGDNCVENAHNDAARIAELEAANETLRGMLDRVANERNDALFKISQLEKPTPAAKPDPRLTAPNGRAMVRYRTPTNTPRGEVWGQDDEGQWWQWGDDFRWYQNRTRQHEPGELPCRFDGTPITKTKPEPKHDPLARAVTVGDMLRLADAFDKDKWPRLAKLIRTTFQEPT